MFLLNLINEDSFLFFHSCGTRRSISLMHHRRERQLSSRAALLNALRHFMNDFNYPGTLFKNLVVGKCE